MGERCFWCNTDPDEAAARNEGPHATYCLHYRRPNYREYMPSDAEWMEEEERMAARESMEAK